MKTAHKLWLIGFGLLLLDFFSKFYIRYKMIPGISVPVIQNIFHITFVQNQGAVFGSMQGFGSMFIWLTFIALGAILYFWEEFPKTFWARLFLVFIIAGLIGNLIDRIFLGYVIDFFDFRIWPVFNVADSLVCVGVFGLIINILKNEKKNKEK